MFLTLCWARHDSIPPNERGERRNGGTIAISKEESITFKIQRILAARFVRKEELSQGKYNLAVQLLSISNYSN